MNVCRRGDDPGGDGAEQSHRRPAASTPVGPGAASGRLDDEENNEREHQMEVQVLLGDESVPYLGDSTQREQDAEHHDDLPETALCTRHLHLCRYVADLVGGVGL